MQSTDKPLNFKDDRGVRGAVVAATVKAVEATVGKDNSADLAVLEGLWLAMQILGGPKTAAEVIGYCSPSRD